MPPALHAANARRRQSTLTAARKAINDLQRSGNTITFTAVANTARVSRTWLYQQPDLRQLITRLRTTAPPPAIDNARASTDSLHRMAEALRLELNHLRRENRTLKDQMARQLGARRQQQTAPTPDHGDDMSTPSTPKLTRSPSRTS
jgi:Family of unknown function (DUF6262)